MGDFCDGKRYLPLHLFDAKPTQTPHNQGVVRLGACPGRYLGNTGRSTNTMKLQESERDRGEGQISQEIMFDLSTYLRNCSKFNYKVPLPHRTYMYMLKFTKGTLSSLPRRGTTPMYFPRQLSSFQSWLSTRFSLHACRAHAN